MINQMSTKKRIEGKPSILSFCPKMIMKVQVAQILSTNTDLHYSKALPSNIDHESL
jgi:hypothetical protein